MNPLTVESLRSELKNKTFDQGFHWRILFLGRSVNGSTDIVSSLSRSLRNLGHHVLDLDLKRHRITDNPDRASGGNGPVYVRAAELDRVVDRFRPQMIVCCAGGLTFTDEDAEALKARGIVLVGITLSDPDVFPSIHQHAHVFDVHTTNAELSLGMYREAGVENTVYFPFGIDRGFVTQEVDEDPSMAADVICLGHANNRPDRNRTMSALAENFDVRTYGRGWELSGSLTVAGDKALQALKMGRIHINFPLTRAGFVNIKCGVFESVGAGAVIATGEFDEMAHFFDYGDEIIGYRDDEDLAAKLDALLEDPAEYERVRVNGFKRLVENHLYEHRWMHLFETVRNASPETTPWLSPDRAATVREVLAATSPRARKVILSGFYGAANLGDELILQSISDALVRADPAVQVAVASEIPQNVEITHGLQAFKRSDNFEAAYQLHTADAVVVGGGGLWHDLTVQRAGGLASMVSGTSISIAGFGNLPLMGRVLGIPYHVVGMGVGPLEDADAKAMVRYLADQTSTLLVRDPESRNLLLGAGVADERVDVAPDVVYAVDLDASGAPSEHAQELDRLRSEGRTVAVVNLRRWAGADMEAVLGETAAALNALAADRPLAVVGLPMQAGPSHDRHIVNELADRLSPEVAFVMLPDPTSLPEVVQVLRRSDVMLTMRLHAALLAARCSVPAVGLAYNPKVRRQFEEVGRGRYSLGLTADRDEQLLALQDALATSRDEAETTLSAVQELERRASSALAAAAAEVAGAPVRATVYEIPAEKPSPAAAPGTAVRGPVTKFGKAEFSADGLELPERRLGVLFDAPRALHLSLPTTAPEPGQRIAAVGALRVDTTDAVEVSLTLSSNYQRPQNAGRITIGLRIGDFDFTDDLARSKEPVMLRFRTEGVLDIPVELSLRVNARCYPARSWTQYSRIGLRIEETHPVNDPGAVPGLVVSGGSVRAVEASQRADVLL